MTFPTLTIKPNEEYVQTKTIAKRNIRAKLPLGKLLHINGEGSYFDTGLMYTKGTGLVNYRKGGGYETFVYQVQPGVYNTLWGRNEGSEVAPVKLGMPYRIIIGDHAWDAQSQSYNLVGARHYYSYKPITSWDDKLYNCNLPNLNCRGYGSTGVGWICLYHRENYAGKSMIERVVTTVQRTSGNEAYNDSNMDRTDGPRFYAAYGVTEDFSTKDGWVNRTKKDGYKWILQDPDLLVPVMVDPKDLSKNWIVEGSYNKFSFHKDAVHADLYTLTRGSIHAYYDDPLPVKPYNMLEPTNTMKKDYSNVEAFRAYQHILGGFENSIKYVENKEAIIVKPKLKLVKCELSGKDFPEIDEFVKIYDEDLNLLNAHPSQVPQDRRRVVKIYQKRPNGYMQEILVTMVFKEQATLNAHIEEARKRRVGYAWHPAYEVVYCAADRHSALDIKSSYYKKNIAPDLDKGSLNTNKSIYERVTGTECRYCSPSW